ncbi:MAG: hypothetical protein MUE52_08030 [Tabrizicola sp.]|jgi:hypothetical protein|nr:hypothetical protein [Tabrizicola sp.]
MDHRFPPLRPQASLPKSSGTSRTLPAPIDLTFMAALVLLAAIALS